MNMKFGESIDVIFMDRNSGEGVDADDSIKIGDKYMPQKLGFSYGTYIHGENLTGIMQFRDIDVIHAPFEWQINRTAIGDNKNSWATDCQNINKDKGHKMLFHDYF